ncbi:hypothetical protein LY78DRAFT_675155 [Colletotrichum sublineola]|nr:hypothetical protein LY78DRAFT_675155 [Colletotrichum sublineola]
MSFLFALSLTIYLLSLPFAQARKPQIGFELESFDMSIFNFDCSDDDYYSMKGHLVNGQKGDNWFLGVDDTPAKNWRLNLEYDIRYEIGNPEILKDIVEQVKESMVVVQNDQGERDKSWVDSNQFLKEATGGSHWATKDVLGFLSLVLTNMKAARKLSAPIYQPLFSLVRDKLPQDIKLWDLLEHLACYKNTMNDQLEPSRCSQRMG